MSRPKLRRIVDAVADRLAVISVAGGYYTDAGCTVRRDRRSPDERDLPLIAVTLGERVAESQRPDKARCTMPVTVIAYVRDDKQRGSEAIGIELLADLQRALEGGDATLGGLLRLNEGLAFESEEIFLPEAGANVVGVRIQYAAPHIRATGDPEIL